MIYSIGPRSGRIRRRIGSRSTRVRWWEGRGCILVHLLHFSGLKNPRRTLGILVVDTPFAELVWVETVREKVVYPMREQGKRKTD
jgi:hypothetical protein